jgi:FKBP-type peptidyl-prolyl cis-trans isomerase FkpA
MTEITRVPLQPIAKGSLTKVWVGIAACVLAATGIAYATMPASIRLTTLAAGTGASPHLGDVVIINYRGALTNGKVFDKAQMQPMLVGNNVPGFDQGLQSMHEGGHYRLQIPSAKAYGTEEKRNPQTGEVVIPAGSDLVFDVDVLKVMSRAEFEQRMQMLQQMQGRGAPMPGMPGQP